MAERFSRFSFGTKVYAEWRIIVEKENIITIHALGDSLVTAYGDDESNFIGGWGDHLWSFFDPDYVHVNVYAQGGRSSRSFLNEGRFVDNGNFTESDFPYNTGPAYNRIKAGDYVLMQFGHNDDNTKEKFTYVDRMTPLGIPDENGIYPTVVPDDSMKVPADDVPQEYAGLLRVEGHSEETIAEYVKKYEAVVASYGEKYWPYNCKATYKVYLKYYIDKVRELGATPVIVTSAARQYFKEGRIIAVPGHHGGSDKFGDFPYVRAAKQIAEQENAPVLDLFEYSSSLFEMLGEEDSKSLQSIKDKNGVTIGEKRHQRPAKWVEGYDEYWNNPEYFVVDNTHQNRFGSYIFAAVLAECIRVQIPELGKHVLAKSLKQVKCPARIQNRIPDIERYMKTFLL